MKPELEVFDTGHLWFAKQMVKEGLLTDPPMFQICLGIPWGAPADTASMKNMVDSCRPTPLGRLRHQPHADADGGAGGPARRPRARRPRGQSLSRQGRASRPTRSLWRRRVKIIQLMGARAADAGRSAQEAGPAAEELKPRATASECLQGRPVVAPLTKEDSNASTRIISHQDRRHRRRRRHRQRLGGALPRPRSRRYRHRSRARRREGDARQRRQRLAGADARGPEARRQRGSPELRQDGGESWARRSTSSRRARPSASTSSASCTPRWMRPRARRDHRLQFIGAAALGVPGRLQASGAHHRRASLQSGLSAAARRSARRQEDGPGGHRQRRDVLHLDRHEGR